MSPATFPLCRSRAMGDTAAACDVVRKLPKDTGRETRGGEGAADGMGMEGGT